MAGSTAEAMEEGGWYAALTRAAANTGGISIADPESGRGVVQVLDDAEARATVMAQDAGGRLLGEGGAGLLGSLPSTARDLVGVASIVSWAALLFVGVLGLFALVWGVRELRKFWQD